jgi:hypothetical protein
MTSAGPHPASIAPDRLLAGCEQKFTRRSGPGGQNRNKVETAVVLRHLETGHTASAGERRSQEENRRVALFRLRIVLALEVRRPASETPSPLWSSRLRGAKLAIKPTHDDFPSLLAEALDVLASLDDDPKAAAEALGCSTTQLVNLLRDAPEALLRLNARRVDRGLRALR